MDNEKDALLKKINDVKKTNELFHSDSLKENEVLRPRKYQDEKVSENLILPKRMQVEVKDNNEENIIKPRKKNHQSFEYENIDRNELEKTISVAKHEYEDIYTLKQKTTKKLEKVASKINKKISNLNHKEIKLREKQKSEDELTLTIEIKDNYAIAMQQINKHIQKINTDFDPDISLAERRKKIYENSKLAETERAQRLLYIRSLEKSGKKLKKKIGTSYSEQSFYHKELKNQENSEYYNKRNPFHKKMQDINDAGGVVVKEKPLDQDKIAEKWNLKKNNHDKNGRSIPKYVNFGEDDDE